MPVPFGWLSTGFDELSDEILEAEFVSLFLVNDEDLKHKNCLLKKKLTKRYGYPRSFEFE